MKVIASVFFLLFIPAVFHAHAQQYDFINRTLRDLEANQRFVNPLAGKSEADLNSTVEGSPYFDENLINGEIYTRQAEKFSDVPMRYNAYSDEIEFKLPDGVVYILSDPKKIFQIKLNDKVVVFSEYISNKEVREGFLFVLYSGKSSLYLRRYKVYKPKVPSNGIINEVPAKYVDKPLEYYIKPENGLPQLFNTKRDLLRLLSKHSSEIETYMKKENVNMNDNNDLIKVLKYYDSL
jgi:hypothetical protein